VDFLLECIGFPPEYPLTELIDRIERDGEPTPWRGPPEHHLRLPLGGELELRMDRVPEIDRWDVVPYVRVPHRLRVAVESVRSLPDSPFDALLYGWAAPPPAIERGGTSPGAYRLCAFLHDGRRIPRNLRRGQVLAVSVAGFALDVTFLGPNSGVRDPRILELPHGASIGPLGGPDDPGGCADVSLRIQEIQHRENPITKAPVAVLVCDAPERPLQLFVSSWQLEQDGLPPPRPGWRIEGTFLFSGRVAGGVPGPRRAVGSSFG
jgi:hypothetical protein